MVVPGLIAVWAAWVALYDWRQQRVPNLLLLPVLVCAVLAVAINRQSLLGAGVVEALLGMVVAAAPWMLGYGLRQVGAGDVKFAAILGLIVGLPVAATATLMTAVIAGVISLQLRRMGGRGLRWPLAPALVAGFAGAYGLHHGWV